MKQQQTTKTNASTKTYHNDWATHRNQKTLEPIRFSEKLVHKVVSDFELVANNHCRNKITPTTARHTKKEPADGTRLAKGCDKL